MHNDPMLRPNEAGLDEWHQLLADAEAPFNVRGVSTAFTDQHFGRSFKRMGKISTRDCSVVYRRNYDRGH